ncbi:MAG TPA: hypothetical protein VE989_00600 [Sphingomicrobium sp.]|jgi:hypothetical protein|nr:hypothetical protein [Sphingomicrobium sp.]
MRTLLSVSLAVVALGALPAAALAQAWTPGSEIVGQSVQVTTNGVTNTVYLDAGGAARIVTPGGNTVPGTWTAANGQLCLNNGTAQECWPYSAPFQAGQPVTLTSSCNSTSTWLAASTNAPPPPAGQRGERGR